MAAAVFRTKFTVPSPPADYLPRPRLDRLWRERSEARLVTVTAAAGWGKTCFLADHAGPLEDRALWYSLDELDRDPTVLVAHLAAACGLPPSSAPPLEQLAGIVGRLDRCRLLVLDDVQAVARADAAREVLCRLLRYLPRDCRLAIAAREPVALAGARLQARGEAAALTAADLALTPQESAALLARRLGAAGDQALASRVHALTEGWPTGLQIVCQALAESPAASYEAVLRRLGDGAGRWFDFFSEEVLADLEPDVRRFLLLTAALPHLEPGLCDRVAGRGDSAGVLADLAARGLFTLPIGAQAWRYHPLLRAYLQRCAEQELPAAAWTRHRRRAAGLLVEEGEVEAAALDLVQAGDGEGAGRLLARHARALTGSQRPETLALALAGLPEGAVRGDPALLLVRASLAQLQGRWDAAERDLRRARRLAAPRSIGGMVLAHGVRLALQHGRFAACLQAGRKALAVRPPLAAADRGGVLAAMGVAAASLGRIDEGRRLLQEALTNARRRRDRVLEGRSLFLLAANVHYIRGDLAQALDAATAARDLFGRIGRNDLACHAEGVLGFVLAGLGDQAGARRSSLWALQRAEAIGYRQIAGYARLTLGECDLLACDPAAALVRFGEALGIARELGEDALASWARLGSAEAAWRLGDRRRAAAEIAQALQLAERRGDRFCQARAQAQRGRLAAAGSRGRARACWAESERILARLGARVERARLQLWRADAGAADPVATLADLQASDLAFLVERVETEVAARLRAHLATGAGAPAAARTVRSLHVRALGTLEIDRGDDPLVGGPWRSRRARRLLNLLIVRRLQPVPRDQALEALWPGADPARTLVSLRQAVFQLRKILEPAPAGEPVHVLSEGETLRLEIGSAGSCDLLLFEAALGEARRARQGARRREEREALQRALALWRGPLLADTPYDPGVEDLAADLRLQFLRSSERLLDLLAADRRWEELVLLARRGLAEDPLHEPFARHLLEGLLSLGHRREVRLEYAQFEARLVRDLDLLPSTTLKDLAERAAGRRRAGGCPRFA